MSDRLAAHLSRLLAGGTPAVLVTVAEAKGSTPREEGAAMLVTDERSRGTIGGGRLEWECLAQARSSCRRQRRDLGSRSRSGPRSGSAAAVMSASACGARARGACRDRGAEAEPSAALPAVLLFGAGHVGRALAAALAPLPLRLRWIDGRADEFPVEAPPGVEVVVTDRPLAEIEHAAPGSAAFVLTHSHASISRCAEASSSAATSPISA